MTTNEYRRLEALTDAEAGGWYLELCAEVVDALDEPVWIVKVACLHCRCEFFTASGRELGCPWCRAEAGMARDHCRLCLEPSAYWADALCRHCVGKHLVEEAR